MAKKLETDIVLNLQGNLASKASKYSQSISTLGKKSQSAFNMMEQSAKSASKGIDTFGNRTIVGAGAVAFAFERTFIKTAAEFERYQVMLNKLQGSEEGGAKALEWIEDFTQNTPYAVNEVTQSFVKLKAFGLDPMDGTMQAIADQASMMGGTAESVDGIATALGQAWTKGKLQGEEALQLLERGVPVWDYLNKVSKELGHNNGLGLTAAQLQDMASKGELGRDTIKRLIEEMGKASEGSAKKQMETWNGMVSNMGDHWSVFQKDVMESGAFDVLKDELGTFLSMLDEMKETGEYDELVQTVGTDLVDAFRAAADFAGAVKDVGQELLPVLRAIGNGASAISEAVGGYGNLAKILASVYALNKAIRIGAPLLKGAAGLIGKSSGGKAGKVAEKLGAMPVYVINMPSGGMGGLGGDIEASGGKGGKGSKTKSSIKKVGSAAMALSPLAVMTLLGSAKDYDPKNPMFPSLDFAQESNNKTQPPNVTDATARFNEAFKRPQSAFELAGQAPTGNVNLKIEVSDERIKVTPTYAAPGITIDPDTGAN
ncbi:tape measure protein [Vibrio crassostreae]|uniref:tape measure protein n=1 Tax=Vibrio crassostreae TaxID=246167 RepID=UPI001043EB6D|nr:tape measure domain-containing protein [Vibrio crassostreae]